jgi:hypothetical protein
VFAQSSLRQHLQQEMLQVSAPSLVAAHDLLGRSARRARGAILPVAAGSIESCAIERVKFPPA